MNHIRPVALARHTSKRVGNGVLRRRDLLSLKREREIHSPCMTKPGGLGVGLSISRSIIEVQGSTAGRREHTDDATIQFTLPAHPYFVAAAATKQRKTKPNIATTGKRMPPEIATSGRLGDYLVPPGLRRPSFLRPVSPVQGRPHPFFSALDLEL
jgi:hypothetical protein